MNIELKSVKCAAFASQETNCYSASLWVEGKKIGTVSNEGHGGCDSFHGDWDAYRAADKWCKANLPKWTLGGCSDEPHDTDLELHCGSLFQTWIYTRDLKRGLKTKVIFRKPDGSIYELKHKGQVGAAIASVKQHNPKAEILNTMPIEEAVSIYRA